jgi:ComF family protein
MWRPENAPTEHASIAMFGEAAKSTVRSMARPLADGVLLVVDLVLPPTCPVCRAAMARGGGLCVDCWRTLRPIEEPWCERLGTPFPYDLGPGTLSAAAIADPPVYGRSRAAVTYDGVAPDLVHALKYADRTELAALVGAQMARAGRDLLADADALVPVPLHRWRLFTRRFNQAQLLAAVLAGYCRAPARPDLLVRIRPTRRQVGLTRGGRIDNMRGVFAVPADRTDEVRGMRIVLVDDVLTTGATLEAAARALLRAGAACVDVLTFARVVVSP